MWSKDQERASSRSMLGIPHSSEVGEEARRKRGSQQTERTATFPWEIGRVICARHRAKPRRARRRITGVKLRGGRNFALIPVRQPIRECRESPYVHSQTEEYSRPAPNSLLHVRVEYALLLQIMRHGVLGQKRRLQPDFRANPFALAVRRVGCVIAASAAAELRAKIGALHLIELLDLAPGVVAHGAGNVNLKFQSRHMRNVWVRVSDPDGAG